VRPRPILRLLASVLIAGNSTGCLTMAVWAPACRDRAIDPQIVGIVRNYPSPGSRALVVRYRAIGDGTDVDLVVPLTRDLRPLKPFAAPPQLQIARPRSSDQAAVNLTTGQTADIVSRGSAIRRDREPLARHMNDADFTPVTAASLHARPERQPGDPDAICALAYGADDNGRFAMLSLDGHLDILGRPRLPAQDSIVLVPMTVQRPPGDQRRNQIVAIALTPVTATADGAMIGAGVGVVAGLLVVASPFVVVALIVQGVANHAAVQPTTKANH
jgi:hypothetical protein